MFVFLLVFNLFFMFVQLFFAAIFASDGRHGWAVFSFLMAAFFLFEARKNWRRIVLIRKEKKQQNQS